MRQPVTYILKICFKAFDDFMNRTPIPALERLLEFRLSIDTKLLEQLYDILKYFPYILEILGKYHGPHARVPCVSMGSLLSMKWLKEIPIYPMFVKKKSAHRGLSCLIVDGIMYPKANQCDAVGIMSLNLSFEFLSIIMPLTVVPHSTATRNCHIINYLNGTVMLCGDYSSNIMGIGT